jgi:hypothetical protein
MTTLRTECINTVLNEVEYKCFVAVCNYIICFHNTQTVQWPIQAILKTDHASRLLFQPTRKQLMKAADILTVSLMRNSDVQFCLEPLPCSCIQWAWQHDRTKGGDFPLQLFIWSVRARTPCHANFTFTWRCHAGTTIISGVEEIKLQQTRSSGHNS